MDKVLTTREFRQRDLEAAKRLLAAMEAGWFGDSNGVRIERSSSEEVSRVQAIIARLTEELAEESALRT